MVVCCRLIVLWRIARNVTIGRNEQTRYADDTFACHTVMYGVG